MSVEDTVGSTEGRIHDDTSVSLQYSGELDLSNCIVYS